MSIRGRGWGARCTGQRNLTSIRWPVRKARTRATRHPDAFVQNMDSCMVGLALGSLGLRFLVEILTRSWRPPVT